MMLFYKPYLCHIMTTFTCLIGEIRKKNGGVKRNINWIWDNWWVFLVFFCDVSSPGCCPVFYHVVKIQTQTLTHWSFVSINVLQLLVT